MCWGKSDKCSIRSVFFQSRSTEPTPIEPVIWRGVRHAWFSSNSRLHRFLRYFRTIKSVDIVTVRIAGKHEVHNRQTPDDALPGGQYSSIEYIGTITRDDIASETHVVQELIDSYVPQKWPCKYNYELGIMECDGHCKSRDLYVVCPQIDHFKQQRKLLQLSMIPFRRLALMDPDITSINSVLDQKDIVYSRRGVLKRLNTWHCPSLGELPFRAIFIEEGWIFSDFTISLPMVAAGLLLIVLGCKFADSKKLHKAGIRDVRLEKLASARNKREQPIAERVAYFQDGLQEREADSLDLATVQMLITQFVNQYDEEYDEVKKARRPGRPASVREDLLKMKIAALNEEYEKGFVIPDVMDIDNAKKLNAWEGSWAYLATIPWIKVFSSGKVVPTDFPTKGIN
ncbi:hypothetical protein VHEMI07558 [[Torrubiella] hemipterigena]|uniref:Uncharacterized protein n=1 Tax=[Torrubiella] hemipterigena TaxID=1531966 RepID=A0A0A1T3W2_9HYPO|nr:hypothetical protein VHEMI07558 [[Torrubiella] hemipterigena]